MDKQRSQISRRFWIETLELVWNSDGQQQVYLVWAQQQAQLNTELLEVMWPVTKEFFEQNIDRLTSVASVLVNFGNLIQQFPLGSRWLNVELSTVAYELALEVYTHDAFPEDWAMTQNNLASSYNNRILGDRLKNLEQAITTYESALKVYTYKDFPNDWAMIQNNLSVTYLNRIFGNRAENLERSIEACKLALKVRTRNTSPEAWVTTQNNLSNSYNRRIFGDRADNLEQSIKACKSALKVRTRKAFREEWAMIQNNLGNAYKNRIFGDRAKNLEQSIKAYKKALQIRTREAFSEEWARIQNNLANAYSERLYGDRTANLEEALKACELSLQVLNHDEFPEQWAIIQNNLANVYSERIQGDRAKNLEHAIKAYELALQFLNRDTFPEQWAMTKNNLANAYSETLRVGRVDNLEQSIMQTNLEKAVSAYGFALQVYTPDSFPEKCRLTARNLGNLHFEQHNWEMVAIVYTTALAAAEILYQSCILLDSKAAALADTADLPRRLAYTLAQTGNLSKAVETLERGRARGLSESLDRDRANLNQLQQLQPDLYNQYLNLTAQLRNLESEQRDRMTSTDRHSITPEAVRKNTTHFHQRLTILIEEIRQVPDYEKFLTLPTFEEIRQTAKPDRPLIYLVTTSAGSLALILTPEDIHPLWLNDLNEQQLREIVQTWFAAYNQSQTDRQTWLNTIDTTTRQLWEPLMAPLVEKLKAMRHDRATLIPTGLLSLLPIHATWAEDLSKPTGRRYAIDDIHFTYAPNAKSLTAAQTIAQTIQPTNILAIDNPTQNLPNSEREINGAIETFQNPIVLRHAEATVTNVRSKLTEAAIVHFSCHGTANLNEPLNSGLQMSDGFLTLRDILALNLAEKGGIRLAILSACETGLSGVESIDEAISLPTGLLQAGVAAVIASLWSVSDLSTMLLLTKFYDFWREQQLPPDQALHQAQIWLRDTTNREKLAHFKAKSQNVKGLKIFAENAEFLRNRILDLERDDRSFAHPFHWAAFYYTGV